MSQPAHSDPDSPPDPHPDPIAVLQATAAGLDLLQRWLSKGRTANCVLCEYDPLVIGYYMRTWEELSAATLGVGASSFEPVMGTKADRQKLIVIKSDVEYATDAAITLGLVPWRAAERIYARQQRLDVYAKRAQVARQLTQVFRAEPARPLATAFLYDRISRKLGWEPHECRDTTS